MLGFEITINDTGKTLFVASEHSTNVVIYEDEVLKKTSLSAGGSDLKFNYLKWSGIELKIGDKVKIKVSDLERVSNIVSSIPKSRTALIERYQTLRDELREQGLL